MPRRPASQSFEGPRAKVAKASDNSDLEIAQVVVKGLETLDRAQAQIMDLEARLDELYAFIDAKGLTRGT